MPHTGVFFIPSSPNAPNIVGLLTERLRSVYSDEAIPIGRWVLEHKLMRDTPSCLPASAHAPNPAPKPRYVQFLSMTNYPKVGFIYASENVDGENPKTKTTTESGMIMSTVPNASSTEIFRHFVRCCEPIWCHRHSVSVTGAVYEVGDFRVRLGEVRQMQPHARPRGTIMEIEWKGPSMIAAALSTSFLDHDGSQIGNEMDIDGGIDSDMETPYIPTEAQIQLEYEQVSHLIKEFWTCIYNSNDSNNNKQLSAAAVQEAILIPDVGREVKQKIAQRRQPGWQEREKRRRKKRREAIALDRSWGGFSEKQQQQQDEEEEDIEGDVDLARQYMELFRFNR
ncbi:conserved hypothetical protein [Talaromyces stipitatus ATCC 10500]|uniref:Mediator of RNA polymerase II transcription subunit 20 n=1 Tax=Talaromyces stipitatus (strain ATCC 10500 / CBS 375.48 / QM 6759 / NRRL 1006) TaxID=441959 RepID=B8MKU9_TALSN|nr:uncharacterized protein TSTA_044150 [Talaromyces stipitatus ATCC 10500]EED14948.1 conserved hypothetical protein [Talaromyces stipitatus ATCC 10500]